MQSSRSHIRFVWMTFSIIIVALVIMLQFGHVAADYYTDAAHGNGSFGVDRSGTTYVTGDCVHCHDTFDESICGVNDLMLFDPPSDQNFCFDCHDGSTNYQETAFSNYNYSKTFGGGSANFTNVKAAFSASGSTHDLSKILSYAKSKDWVPSDHNNPCLVCHNHHAAGANQHYPADPTATCIRLPSEYPTQAQPSTVLTYLWGDDTDERINSFTDPYGSNKYEPPYYKGGGREPGGTSDHNGSKHPDYITFCRDCHYQSVYGLARLYWDGTLVQGLRPQAHGEGRFPDPVDEGDCRSPYPAESDKILSCLGCHEPHGSSNVKLLRTTVNGVSGLTYSSSGWTWCEACHTIDYSHDNWYPGQCMREDCHPHDGERPM